MGFPLYVTCCFSLSAFNILSLCLVFVSLISMGLGVFPWIYPLWLKGHHFLTLVIEGDAGLHRIGQLQLLLHQWLGHRLMTVMLNDLPWKWTKIILSFLELYPSLISVLSIWWCPCLGSSQCCWKRVFAMTSVFSCQKSISLCPASFCTPRPNLPLSPGISWLPTFAFPSPIMKKTYFGGVSSRRSFRSS